MDIRFFPGDLRQRASCFTDSGFGEFPQTSSSDDGFRFSGHRTSPTMPTLNPFRRNLPKLNTPASMADFEGLCQMSDFTGTHPFLGFSGTHPHSSYGEVSIGDGDCHRLRLLSLQEYPNPNPNHRGFTENNTRQNRDYLLEQIHQQNLLREISAMGGSRELKNRDLPPKIASMVGIYGSVYLMAKNHDGSQILQELLEGGSVLDLMIVYREVIHHVIELGTDQFGNYFIQKLLEVCNEEQRTQILIRLTSRPGLLVKISLNKFGTRVVKKLIKTVRTKEQISLVRSALEPGLLYLVKDLNGNHVTQSCLESLGPDDNKFVFEAVTKFCVKIATHRHGCCVMQSCVKYSVGAQRENLIAEISRNSLALAQDPYRNYVVQCIIEQGLGGVNVMFEFRGSYVKLATQKFSSHVVEKCLIHYPESRYQIVRELVSAPNFDHLLQDPYANYVIQTALSTTEGYVRKSLVEKVRRCGNLKMNPNCKRIFSKSRLLKM